jgi:hypothetical protein
MDNGHVLGREVDGVLRRHLGAGAEAHHPLLTANAPPEHPGLGVTADLNVEARKARPLEAIDLSVRIGLLKQTVQDAEFRAI